MAPIDYDPEICEENIKNRRELLIKLHLENEQELLHPALISDEDRSIDKECDDPFCEISAKKTDPKERKKALVYKILSIASATLLIVACIIIALLIGRSSQ